MIQHRGINNSNVTAAKTENSVNSVAMEAYALMAINKA